MIKKYMERFVGLKGSFEDFFRRVVGRYFSRGFEVYF